jgi:pyruvate kinase
MPTKETRPSRFVPRSRKVRILATLGPASDSPEMIRRLAEAGADAFRINMSHGSQADHKRRIAAIRALEAELERPTTIVADLQGPKLRVGRFKGDKAELKKLSSDRAKAVKDYLVEHGIKSKRVTSKGYGPENPIASNKTKAGRQKNRRIEFHILKKK